jgi:hypothetical protein
VRIEAALVFEIEDTGGFGKDLHFRRAGIINPQLS